MFNALCYFVRSQWYWLAMIVAGVIMEAVALYYQYGLNYGPCVLCIHIRIWVMAFILLGILGLLGHKSRPISLFISLLTVIAAIGLTERSWLTFAIERHLTEGSCSMGSGLPDWFALDKWFPAVFEPWELCGWTPELLFGITMAEALMVVGPAAIIITLFTTYALYKKEK
ncbi:disulfide bond formation protein B [Amphritea sp. 2_MG-2023]|uniref:disulfide bond formation protein B n=1 Tax=Amphritea TaxID=515417 RepID=UPI001C06D8A5|nr:MULTISPECIES: disulfide bond formation protein B [Amphritea]MBU2965400.1 disulfide bond formation protein B [Amphritea atlantica]MDO6420690.1 disulfide bond formation protein B [Amphritea sp. 2_MG-2023]